MGITDRKTMYPLAEVVEVQTEGTTAVDVYKIPAGTIIERVLVRIKIAGTGAGNLTVGDDDDADGFIVASSHDAAAGTIYGNATIEVGAYMTEALTPTVATRLGKLYAADGKAIKIVLSAAATTQGVHQVIIVGKRFDL